MKIKRMENTLENKARLFAQYWGQEVLFSPMLTTLVRLLGLVIDNVRDDMAAEYHSYITLKPLSLISDEDALAIYNIQGSISPAIMDYEAIELEKLRSGRKIVDDFDNGDVWEITFESVDYLRSKGYAVEFNGLSVEQQIEYGWIKLKSN